MATKKTQTKKKKVGSKKTIARSLSKLEKLISTKDRRSANRLPPPTNGNSSEIYRQLIEQAADGIFTVDLKGVILYANRAAGYILKRSARSIVGTHFRVYLDRDSLPKAREYFRKAKKGIPVIRDELNIIEKTKRIIPIEFTASPILKNGKVSQIHIIVRDVSNRKHYENLIRESEKTKALQHFISGTTQEIQHPLKGLLDKTQTLIKNYKQRDFEYIGYKEFKNIMDTLETMRDQIKYCYDTTDRLLSINKKKVGLNKHHCDANTVIRESIKMLKHQLVVSEIKLKVTLKAKLPPVAIGSIELSQVFINILTNAIQSIPQKGNISIKTTYLKNDEKVIIDCRDDGVGIPKDILSRVFEPFFTTKHRGLEKSSGLGLSIVHSIVKASRGEIMIKSSLRQGTDVKIILPIYKSNRKNNHELRARNY